jgi:hypothetical protein
MFCPPHPLWFGHSDNNLVKSTNYEAFHYAVLPVCCYFPSVQSKYSPLHPVLRHCQSMYGTSKVHSCIKWRVEL